LIGPNAEETASPMITPELIAQWQRDEAAPFQGWDFSYIAGRMVEEGPPWDYPMLARRLIASSAALLDMDTGGGEVLATLAPFPGRAMAIEGYAPNLTLAEKRLRPLGVEVFAAGEAGFLKFEDASFDLVINRHGGFRITEVSRVLKPGGTFLSQQVAGDSLVDLQARFGAVHKWPDNMLGVVSRNAEAAGLKIIRGETWHGTKRFSDVGALVYCLKAVPWLVDGFSVERHLAILSELQEELERDGQLAFAESWFLLIAEKT